MTEQTALDKLCEVIGERKKNLPPDSYTASLFRQGEDAILRKVGEEACEVLLASKTGKTDEIVHETADLFYHLLVLLGFHNIPIQHIYEELSRRAGNSGTE